jgi:hypothetical protein
VDEVPVSSDATRHEHPEWAREMPWLVQGITNRAGGDLSLFTASASGAVQARWRRLMEATRCRAAVHARQVHGATVRLHDAPTPGLLLAPDADGHATASAGLLLTVTVADCVPVYLAHAEARAAALIHAGWRGVAAGVLEAAVEVLATRFGLRAADVRMHLGPAICGDCYEVGPEVHEALGLPAPSAPAPVDLRAVLARRAVSLGMAAGSVTVSGLCTRCGDGAFFSHRAGDSERQLAYLARVE